jgi:hypothetical protein
MTVASLYKSNNWRLFCSCLIVEQQQLLLFATAKLLLHASEIIYYKSSFPGG